MQRQCLAMPFFFDMGRILALDYGRRRIGMAVTDELHLTAQGLPTLQAKGMADAVARVAEAVAVWQVVRIVVGLPLNMDGSRGPMADAVALFVRALEGAVQVPISLLDERLTSVAAQRTMHDLGVKTGRRKGAVDRLAATLLLQTYLQQADT